MFRLVRNTPFSYRRDILSGIVTSVTAIALIITVCQACGVDYRYGVISYVIAAILTFVFTAREAMITAPTVILAAICYPLVAKFGLIYMFAATLLAGLMQFGFGMLRLGKYVRVLPRSVILGSIA